MIYLYIFLALTIGATFGAGVMAVMTKSKVEDLYSEISELRKDNLKLKVERNSLFVSKNDGVYDD